MSWRGRSLVDAVNPGTRFDPARGAKMSCSALWTPRHVLAGQAQQELLPALGSDRRGRLRLHPEQLATKRDPLLSDGVGEQSIVSDADEAPRQDVEQEPPEERFGG